MKQERVLLVKFNLGRATVRKCPLNQNQPTNILSTQDKDDGHGFTVEVVPAIKKFGCYYRVVTLPDNTEVAGNIFFMAKHYVELTDSTYIREGISKLIAKINKEAASHINALQKPKKAIEKYFESFV